jgi:branched-chain amino acid transport system permease protein
MIYREAGDFKTSYAADNQTFPIKGDRYAAYYLVLAFALGVMPFSSSPTTGRTRSSCPS